MSKAKQVSDGERRAAQPARVHSHSRFAARTICLMALLLIVRPMGRAATTSEKAAGRGRAFLLNLFDPSLDLLPEYRRAKVYWLFHDNYLAAKTLAVAQPSISQRILAALHREGVEKSGKIEAIFGEANPLPFRSYKLVDVRHAGQAVIRTELVTDRMFTNWESYADLLLLACIAEAGKPISTRHWESAMRMWDGKGFLDAAAKAGHRYSTYKLGMALMAAERLSPKVKPPPGLLDRLLSLQDDSGGWITDYDSSGNKLGVANVETTCLAILGLDTL